eukprot:ANDGO_05207.mRNA.1 putative F-box/LRR-repeat protein C02F5.7
MRPTEIDTSQTRRVAKLKEQVWTQYVEFRRRALNLSRYPSRPQSATPSSASLVHPSFPFLPVSDSVLKKARRITSGHRRRQSCSPSKMMNGTSDLEIQSCPPSVVSAFPHSLALTDVNEAQKKCSPRQRVASCEAAEGLAVPSSRSSNTNNNNNEGNEGDGDNGGVGDADDAAKTGNFQTKCVPKTADISHQQCPEETIEIVCEATGDESLGLESQTGCLDAFPLTVPSIYLELILVCLADADYGQSIIPRFIRNQPVDDRLQAAVDVMTHSDYLQIPSLYQIASRESARLFTSEVLVENGIFLPPSYLTDILSNCSLEELLEHVLHLSSFKNGCDDSLAEKLTPVVTSLDAVLDHGTFRQRLSRMFVELAKERIRKLEDTDADFSMLAALSSDSELWPPKLSGFSDFTVDESIAHCPRYVDVMIAFMRFLISCLECSETCDSLSSDWSEHAELPSILQTFDVPSTTLNRIVELWARYLLKLKLAEPDAFHCRELIFGGCRTLTRDALERCLSSVHCGLTFRDIVVHLSLNGCSDAVDDDLMSKIGVFLPRLRYLQLGGCRKITAKGFEFLAKSLPQTPVLCEDGTVHGTLTTASLVSLNVRSCTQLTDDTMEVISNHFCGLQDLCLYGVYRLSDGGMVSLATRYTQLRRLNICGCYKISDMGRRFVFQTLPRLVLYNSVDEFSTGAVA